MIKGVIFDLDGVLVDAVEWHYLALNRALSLFGFEISHEEHRLIYNGIPTALKLDLLSERNGLPRSLHGFINKMKQAYTQQVIESSCAPNVELAGLLRLLKAQGYSLGVASNSVRSTVDTVLEKMAIRNLFDVRLSNQDVTKPKPDPEIYFQCIQRMGLKPHEVVIVEDSLPGIQAARAASPNVIIVTNPSDVSNDRILPYIERVNAREKGDTSPRQENQAPRSSETIEIVVPMAGLGQRFSAAGYKLPKPLIEVMGKPMIQWVVENVRPKHTECHFTFICNEKHVADYGLEGLLSKIAPGCTIITAPAVTAGAACTILLASQEIGADRPLMIVNSDQWVETSIDGFLREARFQRVDGMIMTFPATEKKWSYARTDHSGRVMDVAEKNPISNHATVGIYYYRRGSLFLDGAKAMIEKNIRVNGEFYVCPVYNEIISQGSDIRIFEIDRSKMHGLGTPEDLEVFVSAKRVVPEVHAA